MTNMGIAWRVAFPLGTPTVIAFAIFSVAAHWNDQFWPLVVTIDPGLATPPRRNLYLRDQESGDDIGPLMAGATPATVPLVLAFLLAQCRFTQGLADAGIKRLGLSTTNRPNGPVSVFTHIQPCPRIDH